MPLNTDSLACPSICLSDTTLASEHPLNDAIRLRIKQLIPRPSDLPNCNTALTAKCARTYCKSGPRASLASIIWPGSSPDLRPYADARAGWEASWLRMPSRSNSFPSFLWSLTIALVYALSNAAPDKLDILSIIAFSPPACDRARFSFRILAPPRWMLSTGQCARVGLP